MPKLAEMLTWLNEMVDRLTDNGLFRVEDQRYFKVIRRALIWGDGIAEKLQELIKSISSEAE